jgi:hypothetical protein
MPGSSELEKAKQEKNKITAKLEKANQKINNEKMKIARAAKVKKAT